MQKKPEFLSQDTIGHLGASLVVQNIKILPAM